MLNRNGASLGLILPANRPGKPDNSGRAKALKGTMALELARAEKDPFKVEPASTARRRRGRCVRMAIEEYVGMQDGSQNGQMLFMQGKIKVEGRHGLPDADRQLEHVEAQDRTREWDTAAPAGASALRAP